MHSRAVCCLSWVEGMRHLWGYWAQHLHGQTVGSDLAATQVFSLITHYRECLPSSTPPLFPCAFLVIRGRMHWGAGESCWGLAEVLPARQEPWIPSTGPPEKASPAEECPLLSSQAQTVQGELCGGKKNHSSHHLDWTRLEQLAALPNLKATWSDGHMKMVLKRTRVRRMSVDLLLPVSRPLGTVYMALLITSTQLLKTKAYSLLCLVWRNGAHLHIQQRVMSYIPRASSKRPF